MKKKKKDWKFTIIFLAAFLVFLVSAGKLGWILLEYYRGSQEYAKLEEFTAACAAGTSDMDNGDDKKEKSRKEFSVDFEKLRKINPDIVGWIRIEPLGISYPIVQGEDNAYYLTHTFTGKENKCGSIFMEVENKADFSDSNTFLYGHNMKDKSMFAKLNQFQEEETFRENPEFYIYTPEGVRRYEIFSCYVAALDWDSFTCQFGSEEDYVQWQKSVKERSIYDTGVVPHPAQATVTLMTCTPAGENYRFLVHGVSAE